MSDQPLTLTVKLREAIEVSGRCSAAEISRAQLAAAASSKRFDEVLLDLGIIGESALRELVRTELGIEEFEGSQPNGEPLKSLPIEFCRSKKLLAWSIKKTTVVLAMVYPLDDSAVRAVELKTGLPVQRKSVSQAQFEELFVELFGDKHRDNSVHEGVIELGTIDSHDLQILRESASDAPVIRYVHDLIKAAAIAGASDIHLRAARNRAELLWRLNGDLVERPGPDSKLLSAIVSRLKILANLDISERRLPQDGRVRLTVAGEPIDLRLSTMPNIYGEGVVLRLLSRQLGHVGIGDLGFSPHVANGLERLFGLNDGLILVTGPTGSGKSTTLHAALKRLMRPGINVVTIEDPVEYRLDGASQVQVDEKIGLTFPKILRSLLRQDPDVILIGEIRDGETAKIAVQAALTGHLVLATLHTNSAAAAIPRLLDMGVERYLLAAVLRGSLAQRLVRKFCSSCSGKDNTPACEACAGSGYAGRVAVGEILMLDAELTAKLARLPVLDPSVQAHLRSQHFVPMAEDAAQRMAAGDISADDLKSVMMSDGA